MRAPRRARLDFAMRRSSQGAAGAQVAVAMTVSFVRLRYSGRISTERPKLDTLFNSSHYRERRPFRQPLPSPSTTLPKACFLVEGGPQLLFSWYLGVSHSYHRVYRGGRRLRAEPYGKQTWQAFRSAQLRHLAPGRRGSHSAPVTSAGRSTRSAQAARSRSAQADASRTPRASRARSSFEGTGFAPTASPVSAAGGSQSFAATDSLAHAKAARKKSRGKKIALGIAAALVVILAGAGTALALYLNGINATIQGGLDDAEFKELGEQLAPAKADGSYYVGIFGSDARKGETASRSDVTMLARIDPDKGVVDLISVPRDTMINIEGHGTQKINAAYAFGGPSEAVKTLSTFAGVPITHYVEVHFEELKDVVNELGGIQVNVPESFYSDTSGISLEAGEQTLDGDQALAFARERHATRAGDFSRAQAQRMIIEAIVEKVLSKSITEIPGTVESLARCVTTDYSVTDLVSLALTFKDKGLTMYSAACPSYTLNQDGISYVGTQYAEWQDMMRRVDAGLDPTDTSAEIPEPQASDTELGAATNAASPAEYRDLMADALTTDDVVDVE